MNSPDNDRQRLFEPSAVIPIGTQGYGLGWVYDEHGTAWPAVLDLRSEGPSWFPSGPEGFDALASHERAGRLPDQFAQFRCGAPTSARRPCRRRVNAPGGRCDHHAGWMPPSDAVAEPIRDTVAASEEPRGQLELFDLPDQRPDGPR